MTFQIGTQRRGFHSFCVIAAPPMPYCMNG
jgi:hypothetical protein